MRSKGNKNPVRRSSRKPRHGEEIDNPVLSRKRKSAISADEQPKSKKKTPDGRDIDSYCWICHELGQEKICNTCPRVYHADCIKKDCLKFNDSGSCAECHAKSVSGNSEVAKINRSKLKELLEYAMKEALKDEKKSSGRSHLQTGENMKFHKFFKAWPFRSDNDKLCQIVDIDILIDKMNDKPPSYSSAAEFFSDVKWIYHNCYISYGIESEITEAALKLEKTFKLELMDIEACAECYANKHSNQYENSFTDVCRIPHQIVWAKLRGSPYWPAKCLRIFKGIADVRFFGTHDKSNIQINHCYKISQRSPNGRELKQHKYLEAVKELAMYINNYKKRFSTFPLSPVRTPLIDSKAKNGGRHSRRGSRQKTTSSCSIVPSESNDLPPSLEFFCTKLELSKVQTNAEADTVESGTIESSKNVNLFHQPAHSASSPVAVCMTFSTDDEASANDGSSRHQMINSSECIAESQESLQHSIVAFSDSPIFQSVGGSLSVPRVLETCTNIVRTGSENFINTESSSLMPVIMSAVSECKNPDLNYEDNVYVTNENTVRGTFEQTDCNENSSLNNLTENFPRNSGSTVENDDATDPDDDLEVVTEIKGNSNSVNMLVQNSQLAEALCQVIIKNRPYLKDFYKTCQNFGRRSFLQLWLTSHLKQTEEGDIATFCAVYKQMTEKYDQIKSRVRKLEEEKLKHDEEIKKLKEEIQNHLTLNKMLNDNLSERATNTSLILDALRKKYEYCSLHESEVLAKQKIDQYLEKHKEMLNQKDRKLEQCAEIINQLQMKLSKVECIKSVNCSLAETGSQTDLSELPHKKLYTFDEAKSMSGVQSRVIEYEEDHFILNEEEMQHVFTSSELPPEWTEPTNLSESTTISEMLDSIDASVSIPTNSNVAATTTIQKSRKKSKTANVR